MKELLGNLTFWIGLSLGSLTILDFLMMEKHKKWFINKAEVLWYWLSEQKSGKFIQYMLNPKFQKKLILISHILFFCCFVFYMGLDYYSLAILGYLILTFIISSIIIHPRLLRKIKKNTIRYYLFANIKYFVIFLIPNIFFLFLILYTGYSQNDFLVFLIVFTSGIFIFFFLEASIFFFIIILTLIWLIMIYIIIIIFRIFEYIFLRIAEYPKGPVLALSGLLTGIGAIIKVFMT